MLPRNRDLLLASGAHRTPPNTDCVESQPRPIIELRRSFRHHMALLARHLAAAFMVAVGAASADHGFAHEPTPADVNAADFSTAHRMARSRSPASGALRPITIVGGSGSAGHMRRR